jgi:hypothetical protein
LYFQSAVRGGITWVLESSEVGSESSSGVEIGLIVGNGSIAPRYRSTQHIDLNLGIDGLKRKLTSLGSVSGV